MLAALASSAITALARLATGMQGRWLGCEPAPRQRVYFANHTSHGDFVLVWTVLPRSLRALTRPVAAADYWRASAMRRFLGGEVFRAVLIARGTAAELRENDPIGLMTTALDAGASLIVFPEGTRNTSEEPLLPFKAGLARLALARPDIEFVPVWIENLNRVLPKGEFVPIPLLCTVTFGETLKLNAGERKQAFTLRARDALLALAPKDPGETP
jgi:1-acyl-sn-glycerol-3-phosphate acyltransferase